MDHLKKDYPGESQQSIIVRTELLKKLMNESVQVKDEYRKYASSYAAGRDWPWLKSWYEWAEQQVEAESSSGQYTYTQLLKMAADPALERKLTQIRAKKQELKSYLQNLTWGESARTKIAEEKRTGVYPKDRYGQDAPTVDFFDSYNRPTFERMERAFNQGSYLDPCVCKSCPSCGH